MARVKRGNVSRNKHKKVLQRTKGFRGALSKLYRPAHQAFLSALTHSYVGRKRKKRDFRNLWTARINAALFPYDISYSKFIGACKKKDIALNRKMLAELAISSPEVFKEIVDRVKK